MSEQASDRLYPTVCAQCGEPRYQHHKRGKARGHDFVAKRTLLDDKKP